MNKTAWLSMMVLGGAALLAPAAARADDADDAEDAESGSAAAGPASAPEPGAAAPEPGAGVRSPGTAHAAVYFRNDVGGGFRLLDARFVMDGVELDTVVTDPQPGKSYLIFTGTVAAGPHIVTTHASYRGRPRAGGVFTYMTGYKLNVDSDDVLITPRDQVLSFTIVGKQAKGMNVPLEKQIAVGVEAPPPPTR